MTNMNYGHLTLFDDALNEWLQKMNNYCEMRAAYTQWGGIMYKIAIIRNIVLHTPSPRVTRILVPEKHSVMRKPC